MPDIGSIPGVTASEAQALAALGLFTTDDLLRTERFALVRRLPGLTLDRVRGWQALAELALVRDLAFEDARRLRAAGADGLDEFGDWTLARTRAALPGADDEAILGYLRDAVRLTHTGVLNGNVRLKDGTPVAGASVTVGGLPATTDPRGRFRALRLPLDRRVTVTVHHPALGYLVKSGIPALRPGALEGQTFTLSGRPQAPKVLREMLGDRLPPLSEAVMTTKAEAGQPDPRDILKVIDRFANGDARAASRFLDFEGGRFVRRTWRIGAAALPAGLGDGDDIEWTGTLWALARYSAREIARKVRLRAVRRRFPNPPRTEEEVRRQARAFLKAASDPKEPRR